MFSSVAENPPSMVSVVTITVMRTVITIIDLSPLPNQIIITGPSAIFGRLFSTTIYGSAIFLRGVHHQSSSAISVPRAVATANPVSVS